MAHSIVRNWILVLILMFGQLYAHQASYAAPTQSKPLALVYNGPGTCLSCWVSAAQVARSAGFKVKLVNENLKNFSLFKKAKLWVQPGGKSRIAAVAMGTEYLQQIRDFVADGGGYVGFCAGAFLATSIIGTSTIEGLGLIPGRTELWDEKDSGAMIAPLDWNGIKRDVLYVGGPFIDLMGQAGPETKIIAYYPDGKINAVTNIYGKGKVAVTGSHPEARKFWKFFYGELKNDSDGSDQDLARGMMNWAAAQ